MTTLAYKWMAFNSKLLDLCYLCGIEAGAYFDHEDVMEACWKVLVELHTENDVMQMFMQIDHGENMYVLADVVAILSETLESLLRIADSLALDYNVLKDLEWLLEQRIFKF